MPTMVDTDASRPVTGEELLRMGDIGPCELIDGRIVPMSLSGHRHGRLVAIVSTSLETAIRQHRVGGQVLAGDVGIYTRRNPDRVRGADVAFVSEARLARLANAVGYLDTAPELIVEIVSTDETLERLRVKAMEYLDAGAVVVLVIDPASRTAHVHRRDQPQRLLSCSDTFDAPDILPGVRLSVAPWFA